MSFLRASASAALNDIFAPRLTFPTSDFNAFFLTQLAHVQKVDHMLIVDALCRRIMHWQPQFVDHFRSLRDPFFPALGRDVVEDDVT